MENRRGGQLGLKSCRTHADTSPIAMLTTFATFALAAALAAFAFCAVLLNEGEHASRRRAKRNTGEVPDAASAGELLARYVEDTCDARERLPIGDFLFGALFLRGSDPLAFSELAGAAGGAGLNVSQVLTWLARAEESGLVERVTMDRDPAGGGPPEQPAVRLTETGMDIARNDRRRAGRREPASASFEGDSTVT